MKNALRFLVSVAPKGRDRRHPFEVSRHLPEGPLRQAALLHDVVEDGFASLSEVRSLFGDRVADAVDAVTRRDGETYREFVARAASHPDGRQVKFHDVRNNLSTLPPQHSLRSRYERALSTLS